MKDPEQPRDSQLPLTNNAQKASSFEEKPNASSSRKTARPRTWKTYAFWSAATLFCVTGALAGVVFQKFYKTDVGHAVINSIGTNPIKTLVNRDPLANFDYHNELPPDKQHTINVLILGCDHDYDDRTQQPILTTPGRSDSILMARVDFDAQTIKCLTIPRDTAVNIPDHKGLHKINAAHEFGNNDLTMRTIKERFGLDTDYCVTLDFESFQKIVDAIGGVDVMVHKKLDYDDNWGNLHIHLLPGMQHLNGYKAMGYVRIRHSDSDLARSERQHEFLEALRKQVTDPRNFMKLPNVLNVVASDVHANIDMKAMLALAKFAKEVPKENIELITLPNYEGRSYCYIPQDEARKVIAKLFYNGNEDLVQIDTPSRDIVYGLNTSGGLNPWGEAGGGSGRRRRSRADRRHATTGSATTPRDDNGVPLTDPKDGVDTATDMTPTDGPGDEKVLDGTRARRTKPTDGSDKSGDAKTSKDKDGSGDTNTKDTGAKDSGKDGGKDTGAKSDGGSKDGSGKDSGKSDGKSADKTDKSDKPDKSDKSDKTDKSGGGDKTDTKSGGSGDTL